MVLILPVTIMAYVIRRTGIVPVTTAIEERPANWNVQVVLQILVTDMELVRRMPLVPVLSGIGVMRVREYVLVLPLISVAFMGLVTLWGSAIVPTDIWTRIAAVSVPVVVKLHVTTMVHVTSMVVVTAITAISE